MNNNKNLRKKILFSVSLMILLNTSLVTSSFAMEGQGEDTLAVEKAPKQSFMSQFSMINEEDLYQNAYPRALKKKLNEAIYENRFLEGTLTSAMALRIVDLVQNNASAQEIYNHLKYCKKKTDHKELHAVIGYYLPQGMERIPYIIIDHLFGSVGVKWNDYWDDAVALLKAHKYSVPLKYDYKTKQNIPLVLTPEEIERYQAHCDFKEIIGIFFNDYTKLVNAQRKLQGLGAVEDLKPGLDSMENPPEEPMAFEEREKLIRISKMKLENFYQERENENRIRDEKIKSNYIAEQVEKEQQRKEKREAEMLKVFPYQAITKEEAERRGKQLKEQFQKIFIEEGFVRAIDKHSKD